MSVHTYVRTYVCTYIHTYVCLDGGEDVGREHERVSGGHSSLGSVF